MKIIRTNKPVEKQPTLADLKPGDLFEYNGEFFIKTEGSVAFGLSRLYEQGYSDPATAIEHFPNAVLYPDGPPKQEWPEWLTEDVIKSCMPTAKEAFSNNQVSRAIFEGLKKIAERGVNNND